MLEPGRRITWPGVPPRRPPTALYGLASLPIDQNATPSAFLTACLLHGIPYCRLLYERILASDLLIFQFMATALPLTLVLKVWHWDGMRGGYPRVGTAHLFFGTTWPHAQGTHVCRECGSNGHAMPCVKHLQWQCPTCKRLAAAAPAQG